LQHRVDDDGCLAIVRFQDARSTASESRIAGGSPLIHSVLRVAADPEACNASDSGAAECSETGDDCRDEIDSPPPSLTGAVLSNWHDRSLWLRFSAHRG
jgi:hypothetical protein